ncbi:hypothetical protein T4B_7441 [Trichinella pseudospiralis]|uniref:Uncharacterized protein n=2 Tax=Trichinella pseudospiralis TaxID=6337 RepID=A0A0V1JVG3_TRIPS|nr:hypothetical protein T4A_12590 [Trichinella pseudospiralis]KRY86712.1 hypothetical protein T4D_11493 [Trichinella pseudospiralis]KRZ32213.1 hypothetical protein T4B_7441 [Trichinella pseudospiralis]KRZ38958.1 hypothetical protein T4C_7914 [Trichinella pseudospiralis]
MENAKSIFCSSEQITIKILEMNLKILWLAEAALVDLESELTFTTNVSVVKLLFQVKAAQKFPEQDV